MAITIYDDDDDDETEALITATAQAWATAQDLAYECDVVESRGYNTDFLYAETSAAVDRRLELDEIAYRFIETHNIDETVFWNAVHDQTDMIQKYPDVRY